MALQDSQAFILILHSVVYCIQVSQVFKKKGSKFGRMSFVEYYMLPAMSCNFKTVKYIVVYQPKGLM